jgi:hypothetical protein
LALRALFAFHLGTHRYNGCGLLRQWQKTMCTKTRKGVVVDVERCVSALLVCASCNFSAARSLWGKHVVCLLSNTIGQITTRQSVGHTYRNTNGGIGQGLQRCVSVGVACKGVTLDSPCGPHKSTALSCIGATTTTTVHRALSHRGNHRLELTTHPRLLLLGRRRGGLRSWRWVWRGSI